MENDIGMNIRCEDFTCRLGGFKVFTITNAGGASVVVSTLGAAILEVVVPDREGRFENVALRYANPADYLDDGPCLGKTPGRFANRIADGVLPLGNQCYQLALNAGPNHIHGGPTGFQNRIWDAEVLPDGVRMTYHAADMEENFPGNLDVAATFRWSDANELSLELTGVSDADTVLNLTNHVYWNLDGADAGKILDHTLMAKASAWLPIDATHIPTGEISSVAGTPMDFRLAKRIGKDIFADFPPLNIGGGYGQCWVLDDWTPGSYQSGLIELYSEKSGRVMTMGSNQPGVQIYTANRVAYTPLNKSGRSYGPHEGVAIEMQHYPDSPNKPQFPSTLLRAGEKYTNLITWKFSVR